MRTFWPRTVTRKIAYELTTAAAVMAGPRTDFMRMNPPSEALVSSHTVPTALIR